MKSRREFLETTLALATAAALPSCTGNGERRAGGKGRAPSKEHRFVHRTLGRTGISIPIISMGGVADDREVYAAALDAGITHIDTDHFYRRGRHERLVGEVIRGRPRDSIVVATKVNLRTDTRSGLYPEGTRGEALLEQFEKSRKRLGVEYLDILYLHSVSSPGAVAYGPVVEAMRSIQSAGGTRFLGLSVHGYEPDVIRAAVECGIYDVVMVSYNFKQRHADEIKKAIAHAAGAGLGIVAMKTQAGAFLDRERTKPVNHRAAIKWVLSDENVHTAIPGFRNFEELEMYLSVMDDLELTPEEQADLASARGRSGLYCLQCGRCMPQCPYGVHIPSYMRAFMYAYGYREPARAKKTIEAVSAEGPACGLCSTCGVSCVMGFDVRARVLDVSRLRDVPDDFLMA